MKTLTLLFMVIGLGMSAAVSRADGSDPVSVSAPEVPDFVLFSVVKVKPEAIVEFKNTVLPYADDTRKEEGCVEYRVHQSPDDPTLFETYEHWSSNDARATHLAAAHTVQFFSVVTPLFETGYPIRTKFIELK